MINNAKSWTDKDSKLAEIYAEYVMDGMDMKTMETFVFETLVETFSEYSKEELVGEIVECYGEEWFTDNEVEI